MSAAYPSWETLYEISGIAPPNIIGSGCKTWKKKINGKLMTVVILLVSIMKFQRAGSNSTIVSAGTIEVEQEWKIKRKNWQP